MEQDSRKNPSIGEVVKETNPQKREEKYNAYVKNVTPTHNLFLNVCKAFVCGGLICTLGQVFINLYKSWGANQDTALAYNTLTLVLLSVLLTGFGVYSRFAKFAGAGSVVPITGFANSVASPAIEYKKEGQVFGIGCKIFTIAGPVILYGIFSSWILGVIYYILLKTGII